MNRKQLDETIEKMVKIQLNKKKTLKEASPSDDDFDKYQNKFVQFAKALAIISKKYGIVLDVTGGVNYGKISSIKYDADLSSGDLHAYVIWEDE